MWRIFVRFLVAIIFFPLIGIAHALECSLEKPCTFFWNANTESDLAGYRFYIRPVNGVDLKPLDIKSPQTAIGVDLFKSAFGSLAPGDYIATVTAYDLANNESKKSNEQSFRFVAPDLPPLAPVLQIFVTVP